MSPKDSSFKFKRREVLLSAGATATMGTATLATKSGFLTSKSPTKKYKNAPLAKVDAAFPEIDNSQEEATIRFFLTPSKLDGPFELISIIEKYPTKEILDKTITKQITETEIKENQDSETIIERASDYNVEVAWFQALDEEEEPSILFTYEQSIDMSSLKPNTPYSVAFYLRQINVQKGGKDIFYIRETDPFKLSTLENDVKTVKTQTASDIEKQRFSREEENGHYQINFEIDPYKPFEIPISKSDYELSQKNTSRWVPTVYDTSQSNKYGQYIGELSKDRAEKYRELLESNPRIDIEENETKDGIFKTREQKQFEFARRFVQHIPYSTDKKNNNRRHYPQYPEETLVRGKGDCEDFAILFSSIFEQEPFNYDTALIFLPTHIGVGINTTDLPYPQTPPAEGTLSIKNNDYAFLDTTSVSEAGKTNGWDLDDTIYAYHDTNWSHIKPLNIKDSAVKNLKRLSDYFL